MKREMIDVSDPRVTLIGHPAPAWLVNYADLMTELVCFFVVLYALTAALNKNMQKAKQEVQQAMKEEKVAASVKVDKDGMKITLEEKGENVFFESGSAELSPKMEEILSKMAPILQPLTKDHHDIIVEGHTDDVPIRNSQFASNWELSTARATAVVQALIHEYHLPPQNFGAIGYGQYHPLVANDSDEHRSMNRRVVFFIKNAPPKPDAGDKKKNNEASSGENTATTAEASTPAPAQETASNTPSVVQDESNPVPENTARDAEGQVGQTTVVSP